MSAAGDRWLVDMMAALPSARGFASVQTIEKNFARCSWYLVSWGRQDYREPGIQKSA